MKTQQTWDWLVDVAAQQQVDVPGLSPLCSYGDYTTSHFQVTSWSLHIQNMQLATSTLLVTIDVLQREITVGSVQYNFRNKFATTDYILATSYDVENESI